MEPQLPGRDHRLTIVFRLAEHWDSYEEGLKLLARDRFAMSSELGRFTSSRSARRKPTSCWSSSRPRWTARCWGDYLLNERHPLIRDRGNKIGMTSQFVRFGVRPEDELGRLVEGLRGFARSRDAELSRPVELIVRDEPHSLS